MARNLELGKAYRIVEAELFEVGHEKHSLAKSYCIQQITLENGTRAHSDLFILEGK